MSMLWESQGEVVLVHYPPCESANNGGVDMMAERDFLGQEPETWVADGAVNVLGLLLIGIARRKL